MIRFAFLSVLLAVLGALAPAGADARLVNQNAEGTHRACIYENRGVNRSRLPYRQRNVALGEPCPFRYRAAPVTVPAPPIPSAATLLGEELQLGQRICRYGHRGVVYRRAIAPTQRCPITPHLFH